MNALKRIRSGAYKTDRTLVWLRPPNPETLKQGQCYELVVSTRCFPKFRLFVVHDRCTGDSGVARYIMSPDNYKKITFFDPEARRYARVDIPVLMKSHCGRSGGDSPYTKVERIRDKVDLHGHSCSLYRCAILGGDDYELVYLSDSINVAEGLLEPMSQFYQVEDMGRVPMQVVRYQEEYPVRLLTVYSIKKIKIPAGIFSVPNWARKVESINDVMFDSEMMDTIFK